MPAAAADAHGTADDWEAIAGGSWLNKLGVVVLVTGLSLFLGYSLTQLDAAGRVGIGMTVSLVILAAGLVCERRPRYAGFGRGLVGGGWAALYFTTYAMHGLDAARVIHDPAVATLALTAVAGAMIVHSLRYRSQVATGLAFFLGFVTLAMGPSTTFAVAATIPLAVSLLWVAHRAAWPTMAVGGLVMTYGTYLFTTAAVAAPTLDEFVQEQSVLAVYWVVFETFDILSAGQRARKGQALLAMNASAYVGIAYLQWAAFVPEQLHVFFGVAAAAYLLSTGMRAWLLGGARTDRSGEAGRDAAADLSYQWSITATVVLTLIGVSLRFTGQAFNLAFLLVGETLFLAALMADDRYARWLAAGVLALPIALTTLVDIGMVGQVRVGPWTVEEWTPTALFLASALYLDRAMLGRRTLIAPEAGYRTVATTLVVLVVGFEAPESFMGVAWLVMAVLLGEIGLGGRSSDFRWQACAVGALAAVRLLVHDAFPPVVDSGAIFVRLGLAALVFWGAFARVLRLDPAAVSPRERALVLHVSPGIATVFLGILCWQLLPEPAVAMGWAVLAAGLLAIGARLPVPSLGLYGHLGMAFMTVRLLEHNMEAVGASLGLSHRVLTVVPAIALLYSIAALAADSRWVEQSHPSARIASRAYVWAGTLLAVLLIGFEFGPVASMAAWSLMTLCLLWLGFRTGHDDLRRQAYVVAAVVFVESWTNLVPDGLPGSQDRLAVALFAIVGLHAAQALLIRRAPARAVGNGARATSTPAYRRHAAFFACGATALLAKTLFHELSASYLTMGWGAQGVLLLSSGLLGRDRVLRELGLLMLAVCTVKLFAYDFRTLDALSRILSFIVLGLLMIGASWAYVRYRERLSHYF